MGVVRDIFVACIMRPQRLSLKRGWALEGRVGPGEGLVISRIL